MSEDIHLFFGHQNRTKGYIIDVFNNLLIQQGQSSIYPDGKKPRFSNGSILELKIEKNYSEFQLKLSLAITGDYTSNKDDSEYWVSQSDINNFNKFDKFSGTVPFISVPFPEYTVVVTADDLMNSFKINTTRLPDKIICYFVRHGYSTHNVSTKSRLFSASNSVFNTNTSLTENETDRKIRMRELLEQPESMQIGEKIGTEQALKAGVDFSTILGDRKLKSVSVSDLVRTHETASFFLTGLLNRKPNALNEIRFIYVLPCFHELQKNGRDEDSKVANNLTRVFTLGQTQGALNRENNTNCRNNDDFLREGSYMGRFRISGKQRKSCGSIIVGDRSLQLLWGFYKEMYDGKYRDQFEYSFKRNPCIGNNFLGLFLNEFYSGKSRGGKTRKRKLNKKYKTHKKNKKSKKNKFIHRNTRKHRY